MEHEPEEEPEPRGLDPQEREDIELDLEDLGGMQQVFEPQGVRGVVIACPDCGSNHFYEWDLLRENLDFMLQNGEPRMHEPAYEPREDEYIQWDYGKGYVDALTDAGLGMAVQRFNDSFAISRRPPPSAWALANASRAASRSSVSPAP